MKRIAFISTMWAAPWGGSEELWVQAAQRLCGRGHPVGASVQGWPEFPPPLRALRDAGGELAPRLVNRRWKRVAGARWHDRKFYKWLDRFRPDFALLNVDFHTGGVEWLQALRSRRIPYAILVHAAASHAWPSDAKNRQLAEDYAHAAAVFFVSQGNRELVELQFARGLPQAEVVRNPCKVDYDAAPPWPDDDGVIRLACVGRLQPPAKGQDILLEVLALEKWRRRPLEITLYGVGEWAESLRALKQTLALEKLHFGDFTGDVTSIWARHHALVLPSRFEGLPLVIVEAMLCGRPCIVTDVAGNAELMEDGISGFVATAPTPRHLDEAMERAWARRNEWPAIGRAAARRVRELVPRDPVEKFVSRLITLAELVKA